MISINLISPRAPFFLTLPRYLLSDVDTEPTGTDSTSNLSPHDIISGQIEQPSPSLSIIRGRVRKSSVGVLAYLAEAERRALDPWDRSLARYAFWCYFGLVPEKLIPYFVARNEAHHTEGFPASLLPFKYTQHWEEEFRRGMDIAALPPKKPARSVDVTGLLRRIA